MTVVSHEREPRRARFRRPLPQDGEGPHPAGARRRPGGSAPSRCATSGGPSSRPRCSACTSAAGCPTGSTASYHGPEGSVDKLLMTWTEQTVGHAALAVGGLGLDGRRRHVVQGLPVQPGPERHGRHLADPAQPGGRAASSDCRRHERRRRPHRDRDGGRPPRRCRRARPTRAARGHRPPAPPGPGPPRRRTATGPRDVDRSARPESPGPSRPVVNPRSPWRGLQKGSRVRGGGGAAAVGSRAARRPARR